MNIANLLQRILFCCAAALSISAHANCLDLQTNAEIARCAEELRRGATRQSSAPPKPASANATQDSQRARTPPTYQPPVLSSSVGARPNARNKLEEEQTSDTVMGLVLVGGVLGAIACLFGLLKLLIDSPPPAKTAVVTESRQSAPTREKTTIATGFQSAAGILGGIFDAIKEVNDEAHGARLLQETQSTFSVMENLDMQRQAIAIAGYLEILERIQAQMPNWSREGRIDLGRKMQQQARAAFDTDMAGAHAKWLAGAWLESKERKSLKAQQAHFLLQGFADHIRGDAADDLESVPPPWNYTSFEDWYAVFKNTASRVNPQLEQAPDGSSLLDLMDHTPLRRAYADMIEPRSLARSYAKQFDVSSMQKR